MLNQAPATQATDAKLVMLVKDQRAHLALAERGPFLAATRALCEEPLAGDEGIGLVPDDELPLVQTLTVCVACSSRYLRELRDPLLAKVKSLKDAHTQITVSERLFRSRQIQLL